MTLATADRAESVRAILRADPDIGMGNFVSKSLRAHGADGCPLVSARPLRTAWNERYERFTYGDLARLAEEYARCYAGLGIGRQDAVGVYVDHGAKYLLHFMALTRLGAIPVLVNERMDADTAVRHLRRVGVVGAFTDEQRRAGLRAAGVDLAILVVEDDLASVAPRDPPPYVHDAHDPVLITHSSGTTGFPKAVLLQHAGLFYPIARSLDDPPEVPTRRVLCALPASHNAAITAATIAIVTGRQLMLMSDLDGSSVLRAIESYRPTSVVAFPQTFVDIVASEPEAYDLGSVAMWFNLGDAAHESHIRRLMRHGHHRCGQVELEGSQFIDGLGSSEVGSTIVSVVHSPGAGRFERCVGLPRPWVDVAILKPDGTRVADGRPGLLGIRSPSVIASYWNDSALTYRSRLGGYFLTGDIAIRDARGRLYHLDRVTDTVMTERGPLHTLVYEEAILSALDELLDCTVAAIQTGPASAHAVCFAISREGRAADNVALRDAVASVLEARGLRPLDEVRWVSRNALPVGVTGKVQKARIREALLLERGQRTGEAKPRGADAEPDQLVGGARA